MSRNAGQHLRTGDAKREYFLTSDDVADLPCVKPGGWGRGQLRYYDRSDLEEAALGKYGVEGLQAKRLQRAKREATLRQKQAAARRAEERLLVGQNTNHSESNFVDLTNDGASAAAASVPTVAVDPKAVGELRKQIRQSFKRYLTWSFLRSKNTENGATATVQLLRVTQAEYAALIGRAGDPGLTTLVKKGAWYSVTLPWRAALGDAGMRGMGGGKYNCNDELGIDSAADIAVKFSPSNQKLSVSAFVGYYY